jgi:serine/threonine-protein kinase
MYFLLVIGIVLVLFGALELVKLPDKAGGKVTGLPLVVLGVVTMTLAATLSNNGSPSPSPGVPTQPSITSAPSVTSTPNVAPAPAPAPAREGVFIGASENQQIAVAIAIKGDRAAGYLCDGNKIEAWLEGTVTGDQVDLRGKTGAVLTGTLRGTSFTRGTVTINSGLLQYYAEMAQKPAGLYEGRGNVDGADNRIGWIVLPDGNQVGVRNVNGERSPAPWLDPGQMKAAGLQVSVKEVGGNDDVVPGQ